MKKAKLIAIVVLSVLSIILVLQNTEGIETHILFWTVQMSRALLLALTFILGFVTGILVATHSLRKKQAKA